MQEMATGALPRPHLAPWEKNLFCVYRLSAVRDSVTSLEKAIECNLAKYFENRFYY